MKDKKDIKKIVLAYSGGLDTSIIIPWLKENYNDPEIIAVSADVGQGSELDGLEEKAKKTGASKLYIEDLTDEMVDEVIFPSMAGTDRLKLEVAGNDQQITVTALFDNLGKGASGAAVQNMNLVLGFEEAAGLN